MDRNTRTMGRHAIERTISCAVCGMTVHLQPGGAYQFDMPAWTDLCSHKDGGSPVLCRGFGPALKTALMGDLSELAKAGEKD